MQQHKVLKKVQHYLVYETIIGEGSSGKVFLGSDLESKQLVAVKIFDKQKLLSQHKIIREQTAKNIQRESSIHKQLKHPNIVKLFDVYETSNSIYFFLEYCQLNLEQYLKHQTSTISELKIKSIFTQILEAFLYMSNITIQIDQQDQDMDVTFGQVRYSTATGVCHRDLKPSNILMLKEEIKLGDFGLCRDLTSNEQTIGLGTPLYMSPSSLLGQEAKDLQKNDVWSAGIILYEMLFKQHPWKPVSSTGFSMKQLIQNLQTEPLIIPDYPAYSKKVKDLVKNMLELDESDRFTWAQVAQHDWIRSDVQTESSMITVTDSIQSLKLGDEQNSKILKMRDIRALEQFYKELSQDLPKDRIELKMLVAYVSIKQMEEHLVLVTFYEQHIFKNLHWYTPSQTALINNMLSQSEYCSRDLEQNIDQLVEEIKDNLSLKVTFEMQFEDVKHFIDVIVKTVRPTSKSRFPFLEKLRFLQLNGSSMKMLKYSELQKMLRSEPPLLLKL